MANFDIFCVEPKVGLCVVLPESSLVGLLE
jgi:hypothetical protein